MREEELEKRLQSAFPDITPPDDALHARIQSLQSGAQKSHNRRPWKRIVGGVALVGFGALALSRLPIGYVLYNVTRATTPRSIYMEIKYFDIDETWRHSYWVTGKKTRIVTSLTNNRSGRSQIVYRIKQGDKLAVWAQGKKNINPLLPDLTTYGSTLFKRIPTSNSTQDWIQLTFRGPWIFRRPDQIVNGQRQWILGQERTSISSQTFRQLPTTYYRTIWGIDAQTGRVSWKEYWSSTNRNSWQRYSRIEYRYEQEMPDSLFAIPSSVKLRQVPKLTPTTINPAFDPYIPSQDGIPTKSIVQWWRDALTKK